MNTQQNISTFNISVLTSDEKEYIESLSLKEYQAFKIAFSHLETSFNLRKSNGFVEYIKLRNSSLKNEKNTIS
jgi:hypothetical protein